MGGPSEREGRLEMCYRGVWGAISDNQWDNVDAAVACRQLGFEPSGMYTSMVIRPFKLGSCSFCFSPTLITASSQNYSKEYDVIIASFT